MITNPWLYCFIYGYTYLWPGGFSETFLSSLTIFFILLAIFPTYFNESMYIGFFMFLGGITKMMIFFQKRIHPNYYIDKTDEKTKMEEENKNLIYSQNKNHRYVDMIFMPKNDGLAILMIISSLCFFFTDNDMTATIYSVSLLNFLCLFFSSVINHGSDILALQMTTISCLYVKTDWLLLSLFGVLLMIYSSVFNFLFDEWDKTTYISYNRNPENKYKTTINDGKSDNRGFIDSNRGRVLIIKKKTKY